MVGKEAVKRQLTVSINGELVAKLEDWIQWQKINRGYEIDRSHVFNVLLKKFLEQNQISEDNQSDPLDFDI